MHSSIRKSFSCVVVLVGCTSVAWCQSDSDLKTQAAAALAAGQPNKAISLAEKLLADQPTDIDRRLFLAQLHSTVARQLFGDNRNREAYDHFIAASQALNALNLKDPLLKVTQRSFIATTHYNAACAFSLKGQTKAALAALRTATDAGFDDLALLDSDHDLTSIRSDAEFIKLRQTLAMRPDVVAADMDKRAKLLARQGQFDQAAKALREAIRLRRGYYSESEFPNGHPSIAASLNQLGVTLKYARAYVEAENMLQQALTIRQALYPESRYPNGHRDLATSLNDLGSLYRAQGNLAAAETWFRKSLRMKEQLYSPELYPNGHSNLLSGLANLAVVLSDLGKHKEARELYLKQAVMSERIYTPEKYPQGHPTLLYSWSGVASISRLTGHLKEARTYAEKALAMAERLYPLEKYPEGHELLAECHNDLGLALNLLAEHRAAESHFQSAWKIWQKLYPQDRYPRGTQRLADVLQNLGDVHRELGRYTQSLKKYTACYEMLGRMFDQERFLRGHPDMIGVLQKISGIHELMGDPENAESCSRESLRIAQRYYSDDRFPDGHPDLARAMNTLGLVLRRQNRFEEGRELYAATLEMRRRLYPRERYPNGHPDIANSLNNMGTLFLTGGDPESARRYYEEHFRMISHFYPKAEFPDGHPDLATSLSNLGDTMQELGDAKAALQYFEQARLMLQQIYPDGHEDVERTLSALGSLMLSMGEPARAREYFEQTLQLCRQRFPVDEYPHGNASVSASISNVAAAYQAMGDYQTAEPLLHESLTIDRRLYSSDRFKDGHTALATSVNQLGVLYDQMGLFDKAEALLLESLRMRQALYPKAEWPDGHIMLARAMNNLALLYESQGRYQDVRRWADQSLNMRQTLYPADRFPDGHADLAAGLNNMGVFQEKMGEFDAARRFHEEALTMRRKLYPKSAYPRSHRQIALSLQNLAVAVHLQGDFARAEQLLEEEEQVLLQLFPEHEYPNGHPELARCYNSIGSVLRSQRKFEDALHYFQAAYDIRQKLWKSHGIIDHPRLSESLNNIASAYSDLGQQSRALEYYVLASEMNQRIYPAASFPLGHPDLADGFANIGTLQAEMNDIDAAWQSFSRSEQMRLDLAVTHLTATSEAASLNYVARHLETPHAMISLARLADRPAEELYRHLWSRRGLIHRLTAHRNQLLQVTNESGMDRGIYEQWQSTRMQLSQLALNPVNADSELREHHVKLLRALTEKKERLERALNQSVPGFSDSVSSISQPFEALLDNLPQGFVFVDLYRYREVTFGNDPNNDVPSGQRYVAFLISPERPLLKIDLGPAAQIATLASQWRDNLVNSGQSSVAGDLRKRVWEPIEKSLPADTHTVLLCPDGILSQLAWAALPGRHEATVLLEDFRLVTIPHGQMALKCLTSPESESSGSDPESLLLVGDVAYQTDRRTANENSASQIADSVKAEWAHLPGTRPEILAVANAAGDRPRRQLRGTEATVRALAEALPSARIFHCASHGFFADETFRSVFQLNEELFPGNRTNERISVIGRNPLSLNGLVLAPPSTDDTVGNLPQSNDILTGEAIAGLPLRRLQLAVLSACETGIGEVAAGEGVFGLQRAFHQAGTETVIASLWKVDDLATQELMRRFYLNLWQKNMSRIDSLREAQLTMLKHYDAQTRQFRGLGGNTVRVDPDKPAPKPDKTERLAPFYWAAFQLSGDWQ